MLYGNFFKNEPSRFLFEFIGRNAIKEKKKVIVNDFVFTDITPEVEKKVEKVVNNDPKSFKPGDTVIHSKFGEGIIVGIDKEIGQIFFASEGRVAKIALSHPSLNKKN